MKVYAPRVFRLSPYGNQERGGNGDSGLRAQGPEPEALDYHPPAHSHAPELCVESNPVPEHIQGELKGDQRERFFFRPSLGISNRADVLQYANEANIAFQ